MSGDSQQKTVRGVLSDDGFIQVELSKNPVPYHIVRYFEDDITSEESRSLAMSSCWLACRCTDVIRGRLAPSMLQRSLTANCLGKLETLSHLLENHLQSHQELRERLCFLPVIPHKILGMFVSPATLELTAHLTIGRDHYWANLVFRRVGSRWMCTLADVG